MLHFSCGVEVNQKFIAVVFSYGPYVGQLYVEHNDAIVLVIIPAAAQAPEIASSVSSIW